MSFHRVQQWATFARGWWIYDARMQCPFRSAPVLSTYLHGQHKPIYHPLSDVGDNVIVINTQDIAMEGDYWERWRHFSHSGYPGGFRATQAFEVHRNDPTAVLKKAVYSYMKGTLIRRRVMARLHLFPDENVPDNMLKNLTGQIRQVMPIPRALHEYTDQERDNFPRLFEWPKEYVCEEQEPSEKTEMRYGQKFTGDKKDS